MLLRARGGSAARLRWTPAAWNSAHAGAGAVDAASAHARVQPPPLALATHSQSAPAPVATRASFHASACTCACASISQHGRAIHTYAARAARATRIVRSSNEGAATPAEGDQEGEAAVAATGGHAAADAAADADAPADADAAADVDAPADAPADADAAGANAAAAAVVPPSLSYRFPLLAPKGGLTSSSARARHSLLIDLESARGQLDQERQQLVALTGHQREMLLSHRHQAIDRLVTEYVRMLTEAQAAGEAPAPMWEFALVISRIVHSQLWHHTRALYTLLRHEQARLVDKYKALHPHATTLPDNVRLGGTQTSMLLQCFMRAPTEGIDVALRLLREWEQPSMTPFFELEAATYVTLLGGMVGRWQTTGTAQGVVEGPVGTTAPLSAQALAEARAFFASIPVRHRTYQLYAVMLPVLLKHGLYDEVERLRAAMTDHSLSAQATDQTQSSIDLPSSPSANALGVYIKSLSLELSHYLASDPRGSAAHCMRLTARAEDAWQRAKDLRLVNPLITIAMIKLHSLLGAVQRIKAVLKEALLLERAHTVAPAPGDTTASVPPVYVDALCFGAVFHAFGDRKGVPIEHVDAATSAYGLMMRRHADAVKAADAALAAAAAAGCGPLPPVQSVKFTASGPFPLTSGAYASALRDRAAALKVDGVVLKIYFRYLRASGQGVRLQTLWGSMSHDQKLHAPFVFVALLNHLTAAGDLAGLLREADKHDAEGLPWDVSSLTSVMSAYKQRGDIASADAAEKIWARMESLGFQPDAPAYATLMQCLLVDDPVRLARIDALYAQMQRGGILFHPQHYFFLIRSADARGLGAEVIKWGERCARAGFEGSMDPSTVALLDRTLGRHVRQAAHSHYQASHGTKHAGESKTTARNTRPKGGKRRQDVATHSETQAAAAAPAADVIEG